MSFSMTLSVQREHPKRKQAHSEPPLPPRSRDQIYVHIFMGNIQILVFICWRTTGLRLAEEVLDDPAVC